MKNQEYYFCYIGPTDRKKLDKKYPNGESILRNSIQESFFYVTGHYADICGSGWGMNEDNVDQISFSSMSEEHKKLIVESYKTENKKMPRHILAWNLLLEKEKINEKR